MENPEIGLRLETMTREEIRAKCGRCGHDWTPKVKAPKVCANCRSPYWNRERTRPVDARGRVNKYGFDEIKVNEWKRFAWLLDSKGGLDRAANSSRARSLEQYMRRHGYNYATDGVMSKDPARPSGLYVMRRS